MHYIIQFLPWCDKCPFKGKTQGDLQRHILWIHEGKGLQCELCDYRPTQKSAMTKHIELIHRQLPKYNEPSFSICIECGYTSHIVPCGKFHRIGGAPPETFSSEKYDAPEEVGGDRKSFDSPIRK